MSIDSDYIVNGAVTVLVVISVSLILQNILRRISIFHMSPGSREVAGYYYSGVGTLYAVMLALAVSNGSDKYSDAMKYVENECNGLVEVFVGLRAYPDSVRETIQRNISDYVDAVINEEWSLMVKGEQSAHARALMAEIAKNLTEIKPKGEAQAAIYQRILDSIVAASENRRGRVFLIDYGMQHVEWMVLVFGGVVTVLMSMLFFMESAFLQQLMTSLVTILLTLNLLVIYWLNHPYSGALAIPPKHFYILRSALPFNKDKYKDSLGHK